MLLRAMLGEPKRSYQTNTIPVLGGTGTILLANPDLLTSAALLTAMS